MKYQLKTLGECKLVDADGQTVACPQLAIVAIAFLASSERNIPRKELAAALWPQSEPEAASVNLRSLFKRTRAGLGDDVELFVFDGAQVSINREMIDCDFCLDVARLPWANAMRQLINAVASGFLRHAIDHNETLQTWAKLIEEKHLALLRSSLLTAQNPSDEHKPLIREAAVYLLEAFPEDEILRAKLGVSPSVPRSTVPTEPARNIDAIADNLIGEATAILPRLALIPPKSQGGDANKLLQIATMLLEDLTIEFCSSRVVSVVAPYTAEKLSNEPNKADFLRAHGVSYVLETRLSGQTLFTQLIYYPRDEIVWADRFELLESSIVENRNSLLAELLNRIDSAIEDNHRAYQSYKGQPQAYIDFLKGSNELRNLSLPSARRARRHFRETLRVQPHEPVALSAMARTFYLEWLYTARGDQELLSKAEEFSKAAINCDSSQSAGFRELGMTQIYQGKLDESLEALVQAEKLSPHHADGLYSLGDTLIHASMPETALQKLEKAMGYNPLCPDSYLWSAAGAHYLVGSFKESAQLISQMQDPTVADRLAAAAYAMSGDTRQARLRRKRAMEANPDFELEKWLALVPIKDKEQKELYREGLLKAGFV